jgi:hypothetical protein
VVDQVVDGFLEQRLGQPGGADGRNDGGNGNVALQLLGRAERAGGELSADGGLEWSHGPPGKRAWW